MIRTIYTDVFYFNATTGGIELLSKSVSGNPTNNASDQAKISGDGNFAIFRSKATNIIEGKGISFISVDRGGAGYFGSPTILVNDLSGNGQNAEIQFAQNGINQYGQISPAGLIIISSGENYVNPSISIVPDPSQPAPTQDAIISAYISHPQGEIYRIEIDAGQSSLTRVSENSIGVGGNMPSMDPAVSSDGSVVVYSTQASNLLDQNITRADGTTFYNQVTSQAQAEAILVGPIGEIEIASTGSGYQNGFLTINDLSGIGSGAAASYQVDSFGKISSISIINAGTDYNLDTTVVTVENPRGGTGFVAGELRFQKEFGLGSNRTGGARIHRIEMSEHGRGYASIASNIQGLSSLMSISGDGEDSDDDGLPDAMINSELVKIHADTGAIYLEQRFVIEVLSSTSLIGTTLSIEDANKSVEYNFALSDSLPNTIGIQDPTNNFRSNGEICEEIIQRIEQWSSSNSDSIWIKPQVLDQITGGTTFTLSTLSGKVSVNNSTSLKVTPQSNMLFSGSGFTRAIPLIAPPPIIHGFSEILSTPNNTNTSNGRILPLYETDMVTDDIYLFDFKTQRNERVSKSTFGYPVNFLPSNLTAMPSNRFPAISGNGRHVYFTTDSTGASGLAFGNTNQAPLDNDSFRDLIYHDRMVIEAESPSTVSAIILNPSPTNPAQNFFPLGTQIDISVEVNSTLGNVESVELFLDGELVNLTQTFPTADPTLGRFSRSGIYGFSWTPNRPGEYVLSVQATDNVGRKSKITGSSTALITIGNDPLGISPVIQMTEPVPGGFGDTFPDYSIGSELFINVEAYDPDGFLEYVHIYYNGQLLGEAQSRFDDTYIYKWQIRLEEDFVLHAETRDNDGNIVRSGSLIGSNFQNSESDPPKVRIDSITVESTGLRIRAIAEGDDSGGFFGFGGGISRVQFFANGVTLGAVGGQTGGGFFTVLPTGEQEFIFDWEPEHAGSYNFYAIAVGNVGDNGDHYVLSEAFPFEILPEHMGSISDENAPPNVKLINPGTHTIGAASAIAILAETNSTDAGKIINLRMTDIGHSYTEAPKVNIYGGGGYGAAAIANLQNGSVSKVHIIDGGSGYPVSLQLQAVEPANGSISKITPTVLDGVIKSIPVLNGGFGYSASDTVSIFDLKNSANAGLGARASLSINEGGEITQINILAGGYNYDLSTIKVSIIGQGVGFEADINNTIISNGVVSYISIDDAGSGYATGFAVSTVPGTEGAGSGFSAEVKDEDIVNGAISLNLISGGEDYSSAPTVILSEGRRANNLTPMVVAEGSRVFLEAEAFDSDGNIDEVRFYGNGNLLGSAPLGNVLNVNVINPGFGFVDPPVINFIGGGGLVLQQQLSLTKMDL